MAVTRIKNNQITDKTITYQKIADQTLVGGLFNPDITLNSNVSIIGNLTVSGGSSVVNSTNTYVNDPVVVFNNGYLGSLTGYDIGILVNRNLASLTGFGAVNVAWVWSEADTAFMAIATTDTGTGIINLNNSGFVDVKLNRLVAANVTVSGTLTAGNLSLGTGGTLTGNILSNNATINNFVSGNVTITGGTINYTTFANSTVDATSVTTANAQITGGAINGTVIGNVTPAAGTFTTMNATNVGGTLTTSAQPNVTSVGTLTSLAVSGATSTGDLTASSVTTANAQITGGAITGTPVSGSTGSFTTLTSNSTTTLGLTSAAAINNTPIGNATPSTGAFTTLSATGGITGTLQTAAQPNVTSVGTLTSLAVSGATSTGTLSSGNATVTGTMTVTGSETISANLGVSGNVNVSSNVNSISTTTGAIITAGGVGIAKDVNIGGLANIGAVQISGNTVSSLVNDVVISSSTGNVKIGALTMPQVDGTAGAVMTTNGSGVLSLQSLATAGVTGNAIILGTPTTGTLTDNNPAITTWTTGTYVTDAVDRLNEVLGKLVPTQPQTFPGTPFTLTVSSLSSGLRMTNFTQTDNSGTGGQTLAGGTVVSAYRRAASYSTNTTGYVGPGDSGTVSVMKDGASAGSRTIASTLTNNGTYGDLVISNNVDYGSVSSQALGFWNTFEAAASGTVPAGWNDVYLTDTAGSSTNTVIWYYDSSAPGTPVVTQTSFGVTSNVVAYSSSVPHYTSSAVWTYSGTANKLSGDLYPASDTFFTGSAGGSFQAPASVTYSGAGVTTPLARNLYVSSGSASVSTTAAIANSTGVSSTGPTVSAANSYATGSLALTPGGNVLRIKANDTAVVDEGYITVGAFGTGGAATAVRVGGLPTGATPVTSGVTSWSSSAALPTYEAAVVAGIASNNTTNYSTGYFPVGPDLSVGRSGTQYITFRITRDATSKFDISLTGKVTGCQVAMPGSAFDTTAAPTNGWIDATVAYGGAGLPGTGTGGNGSVGCALGGAITVGSNVTQSRTVTFGTESSHNSTGNYIYVRFALAAGDSITALSFPVASH